MRYTLIALTVLLCCTLQTAADESDTGTEEADVYKVHAPMNHTVVISRMGRVLKLDYQLIGADGEPCDYFDITGGDYNKTPTFAIYQGDLQVASGSFEYG